MRAPAGHPVDAVAELVRADVGRAAEALPAPNNASAAFSAGEIAIQRDGCPAPGVDGGHVPGYSTALPSGGRGNATLEFFCTDYPGMYYLLIDGMSQPLHTEGPPSSGDDGIATGAYEGAPLSGEGVCPDDWAGLFAGLLSPTGPRPFDFE